MKKSKWFKISDYSFCVIPGRKAKTLEEAWDKTSEKWRLVIRGKEPIGSVHTCGLCDLFQIPEGCSVKCPVRKKTHRDYCDNTPYVKWQDFSTSENAEAELAFLRRVKRQTYKPKVKKGK